jgi:hypothetical protein
MQDRVSRIPAIIGAPAHGMIAEPNITAAHAFRHSQPKLCIFSLFVAAIASKELIIGTRQTAAARF